MELLFMKSNKTMNLLSILEAEIVRYKTMADKSTQVVISLGELSEKQVGELQALFRKSLVDFMIMTPGHLKDIIDKQQDE